MHPALPGTVYLTGAGPGDPALATLRARDLIASADVIVFDYLCNPALLDWARPDAERIFAGKMSGNPWLKQDETNALLVEKARAGHSVVRLKGGDPCVFGRGGEEAQFLAAHGVPFEFVPGVSSAHAVPAYAGIPVTHRDHCSAFLVMTGHIDPATKKTVLPYSEIARFKGTRVLLMGVGTLPEISANLIAEGADPATPAAAIQWGTLGRQKTAAGTLASLPAEVERAGLGPPAVIVIGTVARLRESLAWFEKRPLFGRRVVVTRAASGRATFAARLAALGADVLELPLVQILPAANPGPLLGAAREAATFDWILFTSAHGVRAFFEAFAQAAADIRELGGARLAAVGRETAAAIQAMRLRVDITPASHTAAALADALLATGVADRRILWPRGNLAPRALVETLAAAGANVLDVEAYRNVPGAELPPPVLERLAAEGADWVTFASASAADHWARLAPPLPPGWRAASIGPVTSAALRRHGIEPAVEASPHTLEALAAAITRATAAPRHSGCGPRP